MKQKKKVIKIAFIILIVLAISNVVYSKYILRREFNVAITSASFYFDATAPSKTITFPRTTDTSDHEDILTTTKAFNLVIKNNDGTNYNTFPTTYQITIVNSSKFTFVEGNTITRTINGNSKIDETITLNLKINDLTKPDNTFKLRITSTSPYSKTIDIDFNVIQEGAIQTIEDLLDLSLDIRNTSLSASVKSQRFKMTRDLDFKDESSYEDAHRTDYGNVNMDGYTGKDLMTELTDSVDAQHAGFLPIGIYTDGSSHEFRGTFNGGGYSISNLRIWKALQENIGLFGFTINADIRNFTIKNGNVHNVNQTAGMVIGKAEGGLIENVHVDGNSVMALDQVNTARDTYAGGIVGFIELGATIRNCSNRASVTTQFTGSIHDYSGAAGGIVAWSATTTIENCKNYGAVIGDKYVGGIAGFNGMQDSSSSAGSGTIRGCENYGNISSNTTSSSDGGKHIGGIAGYNKANGLIESCTNDENTVIKGRSYVGGIIGNNAGTVKNCHNYSTSITASSSDSGSVYGKNTGNVTGSS